MSHSYWLGTVSFQNQIKNCLKKTTVWTGSVLLKAITTLQPNTAFNIPMIPEEIPLLYFLTFINVNKIWIFLSLHSYTNLLVHKIKSLPKAPCTLAFLIHPS